MANHQFVSVVPQPVLSALRDNVPKDHDCFSPYELCFGPDAADAGFGLRDAVIRRLAPVIPVSILNLGIMARRAQEFVAAFPGQVMYAVKCNPDPVFLRSMYAKGVGRFDVASLAEVELIRKLFPLAPLYFMHPFKAPEAITVAYHKYRVRAFVLDTKDELEKILHATGYADDLELFVRIAVPGGKVATDFSVKFGVKPEAAAALIKCTSLHSKRLGVCFHVGTQCVDPAVYANAIDYAAGIIRASGAGVTTLDIGGGFPTTLDPDNPPPAIQEYMAIIRNALSRNELHGMEICCEAGRGLVADAGSLVVRVEGRKDDLLYINDGTYGGLFEAAGAIGLPYPARLICREPRPMSLAKRQFRLAGPTCDSVDMMNGPFMLPDDVRVGDWIALNKLGAYGEVSRTNFNGFGAVHKVIIEEH